MVRVHSAQNVQAGSVILNSFFQTFINDNDSTGFGNDHTWSLGVTYGLTDKLELTAQIVPYQDDQTHGWGPPGETKVGVKWSSPFSGKRIQTGLHAFFRLPTARKHNLPFEPYSSGSIAFGAMGLFSLDVPGTLPLKLHFNFGYLDNNLATFLQKESTDQVLLGAGIKLPIRAIIFYTEYSGELFVHDSRISFRDNSMRLTHGVKFRLPLRLILDLGADVSFSQSREVYPAPLHEYANWKIFGGLSYHFVPTRLWGAPVRSKRASRTGRGLQDLRDKRERVNEELDNLLDELCKDKKETDKKEKNDKS